MVEFGDVFDEVDEFQKKAKSEEEIQKMCTKEDMTELQRACHLLKKGWEIQKHAVITNLDRYLKEPGANEDLLRPILSSLDGWDEKLQIICANSFLPALKKNLVQMENKQRILNLSVKITTDELCQNEQLINSWIDVFQNVVGLVDYDYAYMVSFKAIENTIDRKNPLPRRLKGDKLLTALALNFGEHCFEEHIEILRKIQSICGDTNFIIRLDGVQFLNQYLVKHRASLIGSARLEQVYLPELYEFLLDEEIFIRIEAIEAISHVVGEIDVKTVEKELIPPLLKMLTLGVHDEIDLRLSKMFGNIVFRLVKLELHLKYKEQLFSYYRQLLDHPKEEIRLNAASNLPCFNSIYNRRKFSDSKIQLPSQKPNTATTQATRDTNNDEECKMNDSVEDDDVENFDFQAQYFSLAQESDERARALIASCLHEAFQLTDDLQDTTQLRDTLHELLLDESKVVIMALVPKLDKLIGCYSNQHAVNQLLPDLQTAVKLEKNSILDFQKNKGAGFGEFSKRQFLLKKQMTAALPEFDRLQEDEDQGQGQYLILTEYQQESVYSRLLGKLIEFKQVLNSKIALWRENVTFLEAIANQVPKFHLPELQDRLVPILMDEVQKGNTQLRQAASKVFVNILAHQQDSQRRKALAEQLRSELGESAAFQLRKTFIYLCRQSVDKLQRLFFEEHFFDVFIELCDDKVPQVRIEFANSLVQIKPYLEPNKNLSILLNERIMRLNNDIDQDVTDAIENTDYQLLMTRKKLLQTLEESERKCDLMQKSLNLREAKEIEEKKKRQEEDGDNKYDYGTYGQTNRAGMFGGLKSKKTANLKTKTTVGGSKTGGAKGVAASGLGDQKSKLKRTTTTMGKSALPSNELDIKPNATRKTSVLLPTFNANNLESKGSSLIIPGLKELNKEPPGGIDNYKRYQQMIVTSAGGGSGNGQVNGYKRSQSLLAEPSSTNSAANKNKLPKKSMIGGNDSSHQVTAAGSQTATKQKNGYQKLKNQARKGALSSEEDSSDDTPQSKGKTSGTFKTKY